MTGRYHQISKVFRSQSAIGLASGFGTDEGAQLPGTGAPGQWVFRGRRIVPERPVVVGRQRWNASDGDPGLLTTNYAATTAGRRLNQLPVPVLTSLLPTSGPVGKSVMLIGTGFTGATAGCFSGTAATGFITGAATSNLFKLLP